MEQCIDRRCMCITKDMPKGYPGLSPQYRRKLNAIQAELQAEHDARMAAAEKAMAAFSRTMNWGIGGLVVLTLAAVWLTR